MSVKYHTGKFPPTNLDWARLVPLIGPAAGALAKLPLCGRILKEAHAILLDSVRGKNKNPGQYRRTQNWIGAPGCTEEEAKFVPIKPGATLEDGMANWETYVNNSEPDKLVQLAVLHAEFEALHPFADGNGRLGRMLVPLFLYSNGLLRAPTFYISEYLEGKRIEYYDRLLAVSRDGDWTSWCEFFLKAVIEQAKTNTSKACSILKLYDEKKLVISEKTHSHNSIRALDFIFERPMFLSSDFVAKAGIPTPTAKRILKVLRESQQLVVLRESAGRRPALLAFRELLNLAEGKPAF